jgi:Ni,Fe-hydrogenase I large subunit
MATQKIVIDPITRIEGHLKIEVETKDGKVANAWSAGQMFRGYEKILAGRHPLDAQHITMRICGVCPAGHGHAATLCLDDAFHITPPKNGRLARNLILGANYLQSHILHFYHLTALDYVDIKAIATYSGADRKLGGVRDWVLAALDQAKAGEPVAVGPFLPRWEGPFYIKDHDINVALIAHYLQALCKRRTAHEMVTIFGGRMPHMIALVPGGVAQQPTVDRIVQYKMRLAELIDFIDNVYVPDALALASLFPEAAKMGASYGNYLSYGVFEETEDGKKRFLPSGVVINGKLEEFNPAGIVEDVKHSYYSSHSGLEPFKGETEAAPEKKNGYSWLKAPRYNGLPMEVGPAARMMVAYMKGVPEVKTALDAVTKKLGVGLGALNSSYGRHLARAVECQILAHKIGDWLGALEPGKPFHTPWEVPKESKGMGLTEAARGALGHWIVIKDGKIANYQAVVPTTWNAAPRNDKDMMGPIEKALIGVPVADAANPMDPARVVRSFDPCIACAVHVVEAGKELAAFRVS